VVLAIDDPADAQARQAQRLREISDDGRVRKRRGGGRRGAMEDRMKHLIAYELDPAAGAEIVERTPIRFRQHRARWIVWRVDEDERGPRVGEPHYLLDVDRELVFGAKMVVPYLEAEAAGNGRER